MAVTPPPRPQYTLGYAYELYLVEDRLSDNSKNGWCQIDPRFQYATSKKAAVPDSIMLPNSIRYSKNIVDRGQAIQTVTLGLR